MNVLLRKFMEKSLHRGNLIVRDSGGVDHTFGDGTGELLHVEIATAKAERQICLDPSLKLAECYMDGSINFIKGDIYQLLALVFENAGGRASTSEWWTKALRTARIVARRFSQMNSLARSSSNVQHHYDLSDALYRMFLDPDMQYSCAYFEDEDQSLADAQLAKKRHLAAKLCLSEDQSVLDIGCGWGGLGLYMAQVTNANVTGVTLSDEQFKVANQRTQEAGFADRAQFLKQDYRSLQQSFDRIVSVGMFEHVGVGHYQEFFNQTARLLKKDGVFVLHSIGRNEEPGDTNPFIRKYIFPGGYIPALSEVLPAIERAGLKIADIEILRIHYAETLKAWRETFTAKRDKAKELYDERFCRMWEFYLACSESAFRWQNHMVFQIQLVHDQEAVPVTRAYISEEEERLKRLEADGYTINAGKRSKIKAVPA